jgi:glucose/arabinose dehydrogenase
MFIGGFDFLTDGSAAVCTFHGDVFIVSGLDEKLDQVSWRRFASGLYHPLGLKVVKDQIYVTCRDGIWRLNDLNADGEADFYEAFNFDLKVTENFHEFVFDLHTDQAGSFYFAKAGPVRNGGRGFDRIMAHHGTLLRVTPDGAKMEAIATGFRAPNGIGVGPRGELTSGDNEGTWTPACKINWIKPGGFYGVVDLAHRDPAPTDYDPPLCWLPKRIDNSGGSQVWVTSDQWGPWQGQLLHLSYGNPRFTAC